MAYFNHAFHKVFLGTGDPNGEHLPTSVDPGMIDTSGFITEPGVPTSALTDINTTVSANHALGPVGAGYWGMFYAKTDLNAVPAQVANTTIGDNAAVCCPFYIASSPIFKKDKIGPYAGGYRETNKSKVINPRYVRQFYYVAPCTPQQAIVSIGTTPGTTDGNIANDPCDVTTPTLFQGGTVCSNCNFCFLCGETYYLRIDVKGSPALRFLNHQAYQTLDAYTGCCTGAAPTNVDPTTVYIQWASKIVQNPYLKDLILPVVFDTTGAPLYAPGTTVGPQGEVVTAAEWWTAYDTSGWDGTSCTAGMRLFGAFVETKFGNCTFQVTDFFEKEPVKIYASMVDYTGDPCTFEGLCVYNDCYGVQGMGFGEQVLRDLILSESYLQNYVGSGMDFRVREVTQGYDIIDAVDRNELYGRYFILHSVPRYNNPTGVFDNDQYLLDIVVTDRVPGFEAAMIDVLDACGDCVKFPDPVECFDCANETPPNKIIVT